MADVSPPQAAFLDDAVSGLAEDGKVICVRLALLADMMKSRPWTAAALREVGGTAGVGVTFLEETFASRMAPPQHRRHEAAARAVLRALLPGAGTDIKGHMRSYDELLEASGYSGRPQDFAELLCILDSEVRLITPAGIVEGGELKMESDGSPHFSHLTTHHSPLPSSSSSRTITSCRRCANAAGAALRHGHRRSGATSSARLAPHSPVGILARLAASPLGRRGGQS